MTRYKSMLDLPPHLRQQIEDILVESDRNARAAAKDPRFVKRQRGAGFRKYGNVPTEVDGHRCASKLEANRHHELNLMKAHGLIRGHLSQVSMRLPSKSRMVLDELVNEPQTHACPKCATAYICPSCGMVNSIPTLVLEDAKGVVTDAWKAKCRELEQTLGVRVRLIRR